MDIEAVKGMQLLEEPIKDLWIWRVMPAGGKRNSVIPPSGLSCLLVAQSS